MLAPSGFGIMALKTKANQVCKCHRHWAKRRQSTKKTNPDKRDSTEKMCFPEVWPKQFSLWSMTGLLCERLLYKI